MASRFDAGSLNGAVITRQGYLKAPAFATRTGVFTYRLGDGSIRRELRHPDDVFHADSLATLAGVPITDDHPNVRDPSTLLLDSKNTKDHIVGFTGDRVEPVGQYVGTDVTVTHQDAIDGVMGGKVELSCGYDCDHVNEPGIYDGQPYDVKQVNIGYNHLAIVARGRAGAAARIQLDAADAVQVGDDTLEKILINGVEVEVTTAAKTAILAEFARVRADAETKARLDSVDKSVVEAANQKAERLQARCDGLTTDLTKANADLATAKAELATRVDGADEKIVQARMKVRRRYEGVATRVLPAAEHSKLDSMSDKDIMVACIKEEHKGVNLDGKSDAYVEARFEMIEERVNAGDNNRHKAGDNLHQTRVDSGKDLNPEAETEAARARAQAASRDAWKTAK